MNQTKRDDYLIIVSTILAILSTKIADFTLPNFISYKWFGESPFNAWMGLFLGVLFLIGVTLVFFLPIIKWLTKRTMSSY